MSDGKLEQLTSVVESSKLNGVKGHRVDENGQVIIDLQNGATLNSYLPPDNQILVGEYESPKNDHRDIFIVPSKLDNPHYLSALAHEIGHIFNKETQNKIGRHYFLNVYDSLKGSFLKKPLEHKLKALCQIFSTNMKIETEAWNSGKIVSDLLGIDEQIYEETMVDGINTHYSSSINDLYNRIIQKCPEITDQTTFKLYNPHTQSSETISYQDLKTLASKAPEANKKALEDVARKIGI